MTRPTHTPRTALVTGASSGIGYQYARLLAERGCDLVIVSNEKDRIERVAEELRAAYGIEATALYRDLAQRNAAEELFACCEGLGKQIDILINNAGVFFFNDLTRAEMRRIETMLDLHVRTTTLLCRRFGEAMKKRGYGYILNMSSMSAWMPYPGIALYAATKSYLKQFSAALHDELLDEGVSVTAVCPGAVATDLYDLSDRYRRLALRLGIMMSPQKLARKGLRAMFARKKRIVPGTINRIFVPLAGLLPSALVRLIKRKAKFYRYGE